MSRYRSDLPQLGGGLFLTDGGIDTDLIFNRGVEVREFAAHTLLAHDAGRRALLDSLRPYLTLADEVGAGFILSTPTWKAHTWWCEALGSDADELRRINREAVAFVARLRDEFAANEQPIVLNGLIGPRGDSYLPESEITAEEAEEYHARQIGWLAVRPNWRRRRNSSPTAAAVPIVVSFTVETDGSLPSGESLGEAIAAVDAATSAAAEYFMVNCAHPDHFFHLLGDTPWARRIRGIRCNASRLGHDELEGRETLDDGDPAELAQQYLGLSRRLPWLNIFGGCCGTDLRHVTAIAHALSGRD